MEKAKCSDKRTVTYGINYRRTSKSSSGVLEEDGYRRTIQRTSPSCWRSCAGYDNGQDAQRPRPVYCQRYYLGCLEVYFLVGQPDGKLQRPIRAAADVRQAYSSR